MRPCWRCWMGARWLILRTVLVRSLAGIWRTCCGANPSALWLPAAGTSAEVPLWDGPPKLCAPQVPPWDVVECQNVAWHLRTDGWQCLVHLLRIPLLLQLENRAELTV